MPRIQCHGIADDVIRTVSTHLVDELENLLNVPREYFQLSTVQERYFADGKAVGGHPFVEVSLFDRGAEQEMRVAAIITRYLQEAGIPHVDLVIHHLERKRYFEDGKPF